MGSNDLTRHASFVGLIYDQTLPFREPISAFWQVDANTIVTCAHSVILYEDALNALRARFPVSGQEFSIKSMILHPKLDKDQLVALARTSLVDPVPALPLQKHNVAVLKLESTANEVSASTINDIARLFDSFVPQREKGLGGSLSEIDLPVVVQTVTNARKQGSISLLDERNRTLGKFYCEAGRIKHAYYGGLTNEMAIYQVVEHKLDGGFFFTSEEEPDWTTVSEISRPTDMLLIEAVRRLDELEKLAAIVGGPSSLFEKRSPKPNFDVLPAEVQEHTRLIWPFIDGGTPLGYMWQLAGLDDYAIYVALQELIKTRQITYFEAPFVKESNKLPIQLGLSMPLAPNDAISALWVEDASMAPLVRRGILLGSSKEANPSEVIHTVGMPFEAAGCPVFKDGALIGMHCGSIPPDPLVQQQEGGLHQLVWVDSVVECLKTDGEVELVKRLTLSGEEPVAGAKTPGCREVVRIQCPKCGRSSLELANFCKGCGQRLIQDLEQKPKRKPKTKTAVAATQNRLPAVIDFTPTQPSLLKPFIMAAAALAIGYGAVYAAPKPNMVPFMGLVVPDSPRMIPSIAEYVGSAGSASWKIIANPDKMNFKGGEKFCIDVSTESPSYVYCLYRGESGTVAMVYPGSPRLDNLIEKGIKFSIGASEEAGLDKTNRNFQAFTFDNEPGTERFIFMACGQKAKFLADKTLITPFVEKAIELLKTGDFETGVETTIDRLGQRFFDNPEKASSQVGLSGLLGNSVYLQLVELHHDPQGKVSKASEPTSAPPSAASGKLSETEAIDKIKEQTGAPDAPAPGQALEPSGGSTPAKIPASGQSTEPSGASSPAKAPASGKPPESSGGSTPAKAPASGKPPESSGGSTPAKAPASGKPPQSSGGSTPAKTPSSGKPPQSSGGSTPAKTPASGQSGGIES